jgi:hypothetical protein
MDSAFEARMAAILDQALGSSGAPLVTPAPMSVLPALDTHLPMSGSGSHFLEQSGIGASSDTSNSNIMLWGGLALAIVVYVGWWMIQDNDAPTESDGEDDENEESETDKSEDDSNRSESMQNQSRRRKSNSSPLTTEEEMFFRH